MRSEPERLEREQLYKEVWTTPMSQLAWKYGLSDRGLAKACARLNVPVPGRGYWRRKETGQEVGQNPLPPLEEGQRAYIVYRRSTSGEGGVLESPGEQEFESRTENRIAVSEPGAELHPLAVKVRDGLRAARKDTTGILLSDSEWCTAIKVSLAAQERALMILDALFRAFDVRGYVASFDRERKRSFLEIRNGQAAFVVEEVIERKLRELTKAQEKEKAKNPWMYRYPNYDRIPSGRLCLRITEPSWDVGRRVWQDGKRQRIEDCLNKLTAGLAAAAAADLRWKLQREHEAFAQAERERQAEERRRRRIAEERRLWALLAESTSWHQSQQIRSYVEAAKQRAVELSATVPQNQVFSDWIAWALRQADLLDPLAPGSYCTRADKRRPTSEGKPGEAVPDGMALVWPKMVRRSRYFEADNDWWRENWGEGGLNARKW